MKGKGFEVVAKDASGKVVADRPVNTRNDGHGWAKNYTDESRGVHCGAKEATFYVDGKPEVTYHSKK